jgi:hypothetical protein
MELKYIRYNEYHFVIFPKSTQHDVMAKNLGLTKEQIDSAGFMEVDNVKLSGESDSLGIKSSAEDKHILKAFTY